VSSSRPGGAAASARDCGDGASATEYPSVREDSPRGCGRAGRRSAGRVLAVNNVSVCYGKRPVQTGAVQAVTPGTWLKSSEAVLTRTQKYRDPVGSPFAVQAMVLVPAAVLGL